jgi:acyl carrier protein
MPMNEPARQIAIRALTENPLTSMSEVDQSRLHDPSFEITFEELGMDSLARMELSIWLEVECGLEVTEAEIVAMNSLAGLVEFIGTRQK